MEKDELEEREARLDDLTVIEAICETGDRNALEHIYRFVAQRKAHINKEGSDNV